MHLDEHSHAQVYNFLIEVLKQYQCKLGETQKQIIDVGIPLFKSGVPATHECAKAKCVKEKKKTTVLPLPSVRKR